MLAGDRIIDGEHEFVGLGWVIRLGKRATIRPL
jgi:hypothetical protein